MAKSIKVTMNNPKKIVNRIINDKVKLFAAETWARYFKKYIPMDSGLLGSDNLTHLEPGKVTYTSDYAHFQWFGKVMVDKNGSTWAKKDEKKHYINANLVYSTDKNPNATSHWEVPAQENYKSQVAREVEAYIKKNVR